jgi:hypothetical protein
MDSSATRNRKQQEEKIGFFNKFTSEEKTDLYSFLLSFVFHTVFLLTLALLYSAPDVSKAIVLKISFSSDTESSLNTDVVIEDIQSLVPEIKTDHQDLDISSISAVSDINNHEIEIEPIRIDSDNENNQTLVESIPIEVLTQEIAQNKTTKPQSLDTATSNESGNNVLEELVKTTSAGLLTKNRNSSSSNGYDMGGQYSGNNIGTINNRDKEIKERLSMAGAKTGDVQISIAWDTIDDIDVHVMVKSGNLMDSINWTRRVGRSGGILDVDMNANAPYLYQQPVENIFWPLGSSPSGIFVVYIHFYRSWTGKTQIPVLVRIQSGNKTETLNAVAILGKRPEEITRFNR